MPPSASLGTCVFVCVMSHWLVGRTTQTTTPPTQPDTLSFLPFVALKNKPNQVRRHRAGLRHAGQGFWDEDPGPEAPPR